jgi:hypothetical protein
LDLENSGSNPEWRAKCSVYPKIYTTNKNTTNKNTNPTLTHPMCGIFIIRRTKMLFNHTFYIERGDPNSENEDDYQELELVAKVWYYPGDPGDYYTAPAGADIEIEEIYLNGVLWDGELTKEEQERLEETLFERGAEILKAQEEDDD